MKKHVVLVLVLFMIVPTTIGVQGNYNLVTNLSTEFDNSLLLITTWKTIIDRPGADYCSSVEQTFDGGYVIFAERPGTGWIFKLDPNGNQEWEQTYGGAGYDGFCDGHQTNDGGYIAVGFTDSFSGNLDVFLVKTDNKGLVEWFKYFGDPSTDCGGWSVQQTTDGGYILVGLNGEKAWLIKTDSQGNECWNQTYLDGRDSRGISVQQTRDGGYIIAGYGFLNGERWHDTLLIKTDVNGKEEWRRTYGGTDIDIAYSVRQTSDDGFIVYGRSDSFGGSWLIRTDSYGNEFWNYTYGGIAEGTVDIADDGGFVFADCGFSFFRDTQMRIVKTDENGKVQWNRLIGGRLGEWGHCVRQTVDGGYIALGNTVDTNSYGEDVFIVKTNKLGRVHLDVNDSWRHPWLSYFWSLIQGLLGSQKYRGVSNLEPSIIFHRSRLLDRFPNAISIL